MSADPKIHGLVCKAMAYRVKYRKLDKDAHALKMMLQVQGIGVHPGNRGGVFPSGSRCKHLNQEVIEAGFVKEEVNHAFVVVEEVPLDQVRSRGDKYESGSRYNSHQASLDELLETCFETPYNNVGHMGLSHNHMILIMRAWLSGAKWDLPADEDRKITYCDALGRLSLTAVAESKNGKELAEMVKEGLCAEVLSWRMDLEEPSAASIISQALNKANQLALRTTELTAVKVLKGEIIIQMSKNVGQCVAFKTVRDRVREQLDTVADDPDMKEVFDYLIGIGVGLTHTSTTSLSSEPNSSIPKSDNYVYLRSRARTQFPKGPLGRKSLLSKELIDKSRRMASARAQRLSGQRRSGRSW